MSAAVPRLVLATHNKGKLRELRELLRGQVPGLDGDRAGRDADDADVRYVTPLREGGSLPAIVEALAERQ